MDGSIGVIAMKNVMIDLETLGTHPGCIVLSLGAVEFDATGTGREFYQTINQASSEARGLRADLSTLTWWKKQAPAACVVVLETVNGGNDLGATLTAFRDWLPSGAFVWGNGANFDNAILAECYRRCGITLPWKFWNDRCYRTLKTMAPGIPLARTGTHHNALHDARSQAIHAVQILARIGDPAALASTSAPLGF